MATEFRALPSVDRVLNEPEVQALLDTYPHHLVVALVRQRLDEARALVRAGKPAPSLDDVARGVRQRAEALGQAAPLPVINATGVVLHTNLGRAPLSAQALEAVVQAAQGYSNLELDLASGERGSRQAHVQGLLAALLGAEAALAVNNNAAAVLLGPSAIAQGREVIVSRGEAVEIGGGFRIPDVLRQSGCTLVEVGTTNRTYLRDYEAAITPNTGALLKVHASNFRVVGFTHSVATEELAALGRQRGIPVLYDIGSGCLLPTAPWGLAPEPTPQEALAAGADLVFFSGDKLLGGPQAGIVAGRRDLVQHLERHPLARALRIDKLSLAALTATLRHYLRGEATTAVPVWRMLVAPAHEVEARAQAWARAIGAGATTLSGHSAIGGGSLPGETLPTTVVALECAGVPGGAEAVLARLRAGQPPVVARVERERVLLDPRTVLPEQEPSLLAAVRAALHGDD